MFDTSKPTHVPIWTIYFNWNEAKMMWKFVKYIWNWIGCQLLVDRALHRRLSPELHMWIYVWMDKWIMDNVDDQKFISIVILFNHIVNVVKMGKVLTCGPFGPPGSRHSFTKRTYYVYVWCMHRKWPMANERELTIIIQHSCGIWNGETCLNSYKMLHFVFNVNYWTHICHFHFDKMVF